MTDSEIEELNMQLLEGMPSKAELYGFAARLLAEVKEMRETIEWCDKRFKWYREQLYSKDEN